MIDPELYYHLWKGEHEERTREATLLRTTTDPTRSGFGDRGSVAGGLPSFAYRGWSSLVAFLDPLLRRVETARAANSDE